MKQPKGSIRRHRMLNVNSEATGRGPLIGEAIDETVANRQKPARRPSPTRVGLPLGRGSHRSFVVEWQLSDGETS